MEDEDISHEMKAASSIVAETKKLHPEQTTNNPSIETKEPPSTSERSEFLEGDSQGSGMEESEAANVGSRSRSASTEPGEPSEKPQYSNLTTYFHRRVHETSKLYNEGDEDACRESCLELLGKARLPYFSRVELLQLLSLVTPYDTAKRCLEEALGVCDDMGRIHMTPLITQVREETLKLQRELEDRLMGESSDEEDVEKEVTQSERAEEASEVEAEETSSSEKTTDLPTSSNGDPQG